jgi:hypothetical protein
MGLPITAGRGCLRFRSERCLARPAAGPDLASNREIARLYNHLWLSLLNGVFRESGREWTWQFPALARQSRRRPMAL